jgi:hypothetical protein
MSPATIAPLTDAPRIASGASFPAYPGIDSGGGHASGGSYKLLSKVSLRAGVSLKVQIPRHGLYALAVAGCPILLRPEEQLPIEPGESSFPVLVAGTIALKIVLAATAAPIILRDRLEGFGEIGVLRLSG